MSYTGPYPVQLPNDERNLILKSGVGGEFTCPTCEETVTFQSPPESSYSCCNEIMIEWVG